MVASRSKREIVMLRFLLPVLIFLLAISAVIDAVAFNSYSRAAYSMTLVIWLTLLEFMSKSDNR
jgi:hypothetical protein